MDVIARWDDVVACARSSFDVVIEGEQWIGFLHREDEADADPPKVKISMFTALGQPYVAITADLFDAALLDPGVALQLNHALPIAAIEREDDRILLRATVPLVGLGVVYFRRIALHVARQAAHMRRARGRAGTAESSHIYTE